MARSTYTTIWDELTATALFGTDRRGYRPEPDAAGGALLAQIDQADPPGVLLSAAATVALALRAGFLPPPAMQPLPEPCPDDDLPTCSAQAAYYLATAAQEPSFRPTLLEGLNLLAATGQYAADVLLPVLLEVGRADHDMHAPVFAVLGRRGRWLAQQNLDWAYALALPGPDPRQTWNHGTREERKLLLQQLRSEQPAFARELLAEGWADERADDRAAYLELLSHQLGPADEALLEAALDDRSKQVRAQAAELLARLPSAQLVQRMTARLGPRLSWVAGRFWQEPRIEVQPPDRFDAELARDGIVERSQRGPGERAWWLQQMLGAAALDYWSATWDRSPEQIVAATLNSEWREVLLRGFSLAARRQRHPIWIAALLRSVPDGQLVDIALADSLPVAELEQLIRERLGADPQLFGSAWPLLLRHKAAWGIELGRAVIGALGRKLAAGSASSDQTIFLHSETLAQRLPVELSEAALAAWPDHLRRLRPYAEAFERFARIMLFRQELVKEIRG
jgi:hypothetical protein